MVRRARLDPLQPRADGEAGAAGRKREFLSVTGLFLLIVCTVLQILATIRGPTNFLGLNIFDLHSKALLLLGGMTGMQLYLFSCMLFLKKRESPTRLTASLIRIDEGTLFFLLLAILVAEGLLIAGVVTNWALNNFADLNLTNVLFPGIHFIGLPVLLAIGLLGLHVFKKSDTE